jgi:hypothetical protein
VVLDPYWYTKDKPGNKIDNWGWTLGEEQYHWLIQTLENSQESFKFVFIHHLVGGCGEASRGGVECARYYEWGGTNTDETYGFQTHRPNWSEPIHDILVQNNVSIVFHGHDHVFVKQDLDGIVYQECPQPSNREYEKGEKLAAESGYVLGDVVNGSGHLRIAVSASKVQVDFIRAFLPEDENTNRKNQEIAYSYTDMTGVWHGIPRKKIFLIISSICRISRHRTGLIDNTIKFLFYKNVIMTLKANTDIICNH